MSLQVGALCYADLAGAAAAACSAHVPVTSVQNGVIVTLSCAGVTPEGALHMQTAYTPMGSSSAPTVAFSDMPVVFGDCWYGDAVSAGITIAVAVAAALVIPWGLMRINRVLAWGRGEAS